jgi:L-methionine (R)-S-oxide reductase
MSGMGGVLDELKALADSDLPRRDRAHKAASLIRSARMYRWVGLYDVTAAEIVAIGWTGSQAPAYPRFPVTQGLSGAAVAAREPIVVPDVTKDPRYLTTFGSTRSEAIFPVKADADGGVFGTIDVESERVNAFQLEDETFLQDCARVLLPLWRP